MHRKTAAAPGPPLLRGAARGMGATSPHSADKLFTL